MHNDTTCYIHCPSLILRKQQEREEEEAKTSKLIIFSFVGLDRDKNVVNITPARDQKRRLFFFSQNTQKHQQQQKQLIQQTNTSDGIIEPNRHFRHHGRVFQSRTVHGPNAINRVEFHRFSKHRFLQRTALSQSHRRIHVTVWVPKLEKERRRERRHGRAAAKLKVYKSRHEGRNNERCERRVHPGRTDGEDLERARDFVDGKYRRQKLRRESIFHQHRPQRLPRLVRQIVAVRAPGVR